MDYFILGLFGVNSTHLASRRRGFMGEWGCIYDLRIASLLLVVLLGIFDLFDLVGFLHHLYAFQIPAEFLLLLILLVDCSDSLKSHV